MAALPIEMPREAIAEFCGRNHMRKLSLFGSILTPRFRDESDIDVLSNSSPVVVRDSWASSAWSASSPGCSAARSISGRLAI